jgi:ubiquinone/menaquinone biosynthesis C-methylase UbiE
MVSRKKQQKVEEVLRMSYMRNSRQKKDLGITGWMAKWYDKNTRTSRLAEMRTYADLVGATVQKDATVLEIAPGPGYLSIELAKRGFTTTGVEISADFVEIEKRNAREAGVDVDFRQGNASAIPLDAERFDLTICTAAFKNFKEPLNALHEMHRVLKPGGVAIILDMNRECSKEDIAAELNKMGAKGFDRWFVGLSFRTFLRNGAYTKSGFEELIARTAFARHEIKKSGIGFEVRLYKGETQK